MRRCRHDALLEISATARPCLVDPLRLQRLVDILPHPTEQQPLILACLGQDEKDLALGQLFPANDARLRERRPGLCRIYSDALTSHSAHPIYFVDIDPSKALSTEDVEAHCHESRSFRVRADAGLQDNLFPMLMRRLLLPFFDAICIFSQDFGGLSGVLKQMKSWYRGDAATTSSPCQARLTVVVPDEITPTARLEEDAFLAEVRGLGQNFASISIVRISPRPLRNARYLPLHELLLRSELEAARITRDTNQHLFTGDHLASFFSQCVAHTATCVDKPFDFLAASRVGVPFSSQFADCFSAFLRAARRSAMPHRSLASLVATALIKDAYPPSSHHFSPDQTFRTLYYGALSKAFEEQYFRHSKAPKTVAHHLLMEQMIAFLSHEFARTWRVMVEQKSDAATMHKNRFADRATGTHLAEVHSNLFCSICLIRRPEHVLDCRHAVCDLCTKIYGSARLAEEYTYAFRHCVACGAATNLLVRLKPPTAGVRILSVDGGGVRGIIPLEFLNLLQSSLGATYRVQDLFDLAIGTSAGGLVVLGLFSKQWDVQKSLSTFRALANKFFTTTLSASFPSLARLRSYVRCIVQDSCYKTEALNDTLRESFNETTRTFDYPETGVSQCKVAVTSTTISDASTRLFMNYNGSNPWASESGYKGIRPEAAEAEPLLWQAGRATSAAPGLFTPFTMPGIGTFQDGALRHNNPINIALWESARIWPCGTARDVVLSLGTGTAPIVKTPQSATAPHPGLGRRTLSDGFIPRLCRSFMTSLDGELTWRNLLNHFGRDDEHGFFRLNIQFDGDEPGLDDVSAMAKLSQDVNDCKDDEKIADIKSALLASCFFFELRRAPRFDSNGFYICQGDIRIRGSHTEVFAALSEMGAGPIEFFKDHVSLGQLEVSTDVCTDCLRFRKKVCFFVRQTTELVTLSISMGPFKRPLGGFPQAMGWFCHEQHLVSAFYSDALPSQCVCQQLAQQRSAMPIKRRPSKATLSQAKVKRLRSSSAVRLRVAL